MADDLKAFVSKIRSGNRLQGYDEAATKQAVILPLLHLLGWDTYDPDEVKPEYSVANRRVDCALRLNGANKAFLEAKKISEELNEHRDQLLEYAFREGVGLAILTNGVTWWFYLPLREGNWEQRKFYTIDLLQQEQDDIASKFGDILSRTAIASGQAIRNAEQLYAVQQRSQRLATDLPKAWNKIVSDPDGLLVELLNDTVEKISGFRAEEHYLEQFIAKHLSRFLVDETEMAQPSVSRSSAPRTVAPRRAVRFRRVDANNHLSYSGKTVIGFVFNNTSHQVASWKELLITLTQRIFADHRHELDKCLQIVGRKRRYFSREPGDLHTPKRIEHTGIYVETNLGANQIVEISHRLLDAFGYRDSDLEIETR